ncbi:MAG: hypothetical protein ACPHGV_06755 [Synechococcus sp.]
MKRIAILFCMLTAWPASAWSETTREQQATIARWTAENICKMGIETFYSMSEESMQTLFEQQTTMNYEDIPIAPTEAERNKITSQLTGYITSVCPDELDNYKNYKKR